MTKTFTCILCPNGCQVAVEYEGEAGELAVLSPAGCILAASEPAGCITAASEPAGCITAASEPAGCILAASESAGCIAADVEPAKILSVRGNLCGKGEAYAKQELLNPLRSIASVVKVEGGELPLVSVRLNRPIPKSRIFPVMEEIRRQCLHAPVSIGQVVIADVLGLGSDVIATKNVAAR